MKIEGIITTSANSSNKWSYESINHEWIRMYNPCQLWIENSVPKNQFIGQLSCCFFFFPCSNISYPSECWYSAKSEGSCNTPVFTIILKTDPWQSLFLHKDNLQTITKSVFPQDENKILSWFLIPKNLIYHDLLNKQCPVNHRHR